MQWVTIFFAIAELPACGANRVPYRGENYFITYKSKALSLIGQLLKYYLQMDER